MPLNCGIVGLPNVGKSTLFNAITNTTNAQSANYPFCTIEPNTGIVPVADARLNQIAKIAGSEKIIPNTIEVVDIAGLVKGASKGEGLGNQFLGNIRQTDAILHIVRCFEDADIIHVDGKVDPLRDIEVIDTELLLADMASLQKRLENTQKKAKTAKGLDGEIDVIKTLLSEMNSGIMASKIQFANEELIIKKSLQLITDKPVIIICNTDENGLKNGNNLIKEVQNFASNNGLKSAVICAKLEAELSEFSESEKMSMLAELGAQSTGLEQIAKLGFDTLGLISFFTAGPKEARGWNLKSGSFAPQAAGVIHTDFEKGFIKAETMSFDDYIKYNGESGARQNGKFRLEGRDYVVQDGDVMHFKFNV